MQNNTQQVIYTTAGIIRISEEAAVFCAVSQSNHKFRFRHSFISFLKRNFHIFGDRACNQKGIGMARGSYEVYAETLNVV